MGAVLQGEAVLVAKLAEVRVVKAGARLEVAMVAEEVEVTGQYQGLRRHLQRM